MNPNEESETYLSLAFMLLDGRSLCTLRDSAQMGDSNYYTMHYLELSDGTAICQEKIIEGSRKPLDTTGSPELQIKKAWLSRRTLIRCASP
jgi:hypothetical protein